MLYPLLELKLPVDNSFVFSGFCVRVFSFVFFVHSFVYACSAATSALQHRKVTSDTNAIDLALR